MHPPLESKQIDLRELQHVINDDLPLPLSHGNPLPQMWPLLIFCSVSIYSLMAGNAGGLYNHNCRVNEAQMLVPRMQIFFSFQVREGYWTKCSQNPGIATPKKEWSPPIITTFFNRDHDICDIVSQMALHQQRRKRMDGEHDYRKPVFRISPKTVSEILDFLAWLPIDWKSCWFWIIQKCFGDITYFQ